MACPICDGSRCVCTVCHESAVLCVCDAEEWAPCPQCGADPDVPDEELTDALTRLAFAHPVTK